MIKRVGHLAIILFDKLYCNSCDILAVIVAGASALSVTMGAHRLYTHRAFKCNDWVRFLLVFGQTVAGQVSFKQFIDVQTQCRPASFYFYVKKKNCKDVTNRIFPQNCLYVWIRDHRQHHKYSDTNGDPHNASRGFFFSHIGWLMVRKHPDVIEKGKKIDMADIEMDEFVMFQKKLVCRQSFKLHEIRIFILLRIFPLTRFRYYKILFTTLAMLMPMVIPYVLWGEPLWNGFFVCFLFRLMTVLNLTWLVNSAAHLYGNKPFTK